LSQVWSAVWLLSSVEEEEDAMRLSRVALLVPIPLPLGNACFNTVFTLSFIEFSPTADPPHIRARQGVGSQCRCLCK